MVHGVGQKKVADYGETFLAVILTHCDQANVPMDVAVTHVAAPPVAKLPNANAMAAFPHFETGLPIAQIAEKIDRAESTVHSYLCDFIKYKKITDPTRWVSAQTAAAVSAAYEKLGPGPLKPLFVELKEQVSYNDIRTVLSCLENQNQEVAS